ncbi:hypothetical protein WM46_13365 [Citrobacter freundii complex sp. CFNIH2]|uniref:acyltransferase family protein n=1 Tax=Citrobacter freundii complex sp. CFNIH2 TaxID=2066049 RepID=UPI000CA28D05|nr:acyltransferase family protein [Citrobacter freundii complex sp. CFNIH2]AUO65665.1 hypothetical protein WM46_13365 [Citrobacter freundii complex sp. CFNIH2]
MLVTFLFVMYTIHDRNFACWRPVLEYRKELDGLRTLAVLAVITYHSKLMLNGMSILPGGFLGVDVFFVLSGYLITGIVLSGLQKNNFSFLSFYERRIKRIVPAMVVVLIATSLFFYNLLLPEPLISYSKSLISASIFLSNFYFFFEDSYTAPDSIFKPLLHTWSLGVEWQFYMAFPVIVYSVFKFFRSKLFYSLVLLGVASLVIACMTVDNHPEFAFYLLPSRAWELIAGGLCSYVNRDNLASYIKHRTPLLMRLIPVAGVMAIIFSMSLINDGMSLPSLWTVIPVAGTCLFICSSNSSDLATKILSTKVIVFLGMISYSLYLWHQPVFVYYRTINEASLTIKEALLLTSISILLAVVTYYTIENPMRKIKSHKFVAVIMSVVLVITVSGCMVVKNDGYPQRLKSVSAFFDNGPVMNEMDECGNGMGKRCLYINKEHNRNMILVGDSHAQAMSKSLYDLAIKQNYNFINLSMAGCPVISTLRRTLKDGTDEACKELSIKADEFISSNENSIIVYMSRMPLYMLNYKYKIGTWIFSNDGGSVSESINKKLTEWAGNNKLILVYPVPQSPVDVPSEVNKEIIKINGVGKKIQTLQNVDFLSFNNKKYDKLWSESFVKADALFDSINSDNVVRVYPVSLLCMSNTCRVSNGEHLLYKDNNHLNYYGMNLLVKEIREVAIE